MNDSNNIIRLPLWETVSRSFLYVLGNMNVFWKIASVWFILAVVDAFNGFGMLKSFNQAVSPAGYVYQMLMVAAYGIAVVCISVAMCRKIILHQKFPLFYVSFGLRELKFIGYLFIISAFIMSGKLLTLFAFGGKAVFLGTAPASPEAQLTSLIVILVLSFFAFRFYLVYPAVSVDEKKFTLKDSWKLTYGNNITLCIGYMLMSLPLITVLVFLVYADKLLSGGLIGNLVMLVIFTIFYFFDAALKASFLSHVYQYLMFYTEKRQK